MMLQRLISVEPYLMRQSQRELDLVRSYIGIASPLQGSADVRRTKSEGRTSSSKGAHGGLRSIGGGIGELEIQATTLMVRR